ncbi:hypothetical protein LCGC14_0459890 [marine sediment metagenome]|uniref:Nucleotide modification associated domain-containing protein n=1 Tax=marine sediment metagenome TaxID=412755 RepID=A0A0F9V252_9ZZZZ|nr:hypothetical protein [bacterium]
MSISSRLAKLLKKKKCHNSFKIKIKGFIQKIMKIILSRKGFDSQFGGEGSPILPDGTLLSFSIPSMKYTSKILYDGNDYEPTQYKDLQIPPNIQNSLLEDGIKRIITYKGLDFLKC